MNSPQESMMRPLRTYIEMEYIERKMPAANKEYFTEKNFWRGISLRMMPTLQPNIPKQNNSFDCGLFLLEYAEIFVENQDFILDNLKQMGVELFKEEWIDMKRDVLKRLIISLIAGRTPEEVGRDY